MGKRQTNRSKRGMRARGSTSSRAAMTYSPLGWIVLLGPLFIILSVLLFGRSMPFLVEVARKEAGDTALVYTVVGKQHMDAGRYPEAQAYFLKALEYRDDCIEALVNLGKLSYLAGETDTAIHWLEKAVGLDPPQLGLIYNNLGAFRGKQGDIKAALQYFEKAEEAGMKTANVYRNIGEANYLLKRWPEMARAYRNAIAHRTTVKTLYMQRLRETIAESYQDPARRELHEKAVAHYRSDIPGGHFDRYDSDVVEELLVDRNRIAADYASLAEALARLGRKEEAARIRRIAAETVGPELRGAGLEGE